MFLLGYCVGEYFIHAYFFKPFQQYEHQIAELSEVRYHNRFVTVFAQEFMAEGTFSAKLNRTMQSLYVSVERVFAQLEDRRKVREDIYGKVEEIRNLVKAPSLGVMATPVYKNIEASLADVQISLN